MRLTLSSLEAPNELVYGPGRLERRRLIPVVGESGNIFSLSAVRSSPLAIQNAPCSILSSVGGTEFERERTELVESAFSSHSVLGSGSDVCLGAICAGICSAQKNPTYL